VQVASTKIQQYKNIDGTYVSTSYVSIYSFRSVRHFCKLHIITVFTQPALIDSPSKLQY